MHQPINPGGEDRGVPGDYPLQSGIRLAATESVMWDRLFRKMWPTCGVVARTQLVDRMLRSLQMEPDGPPMSKHERLSRLRQMQLSLDKLPPDVNNKLMRG